MKRLVLAIVLVLFAGGNVLFILAAANAVPRYSARYEQNCSLCHFNPTGGGLRSVYATKYLIPDEIAATKPAQEVMETIDPEISKNVTIGADLRLLHVFSDEDEHVLNFFQMQGDLYVNFQMGNRLALYYDHGISQSYELFGAAYVLPHNGYVKIGRFVPDYGWKVDDHTMFVREQLEFFPPRHSDVGIELGMFPKRFALTASVVNGARGSLQDQNKDVAVITRADYRFNAAGVGLCFGISGMHNPSADGVHEAVGPFGYLNWKRITYLGEWDWERFDPSGAPHRTGLALSQELNVEVRQGLEVRGTYDFYDPDINLEAGSRDRFGGGVFLLLNPFVAVEVLGRQYQFDEGPSVVGKDYYESVVQFHFLF